MKTRTARKVAGILRSHPELKSADLHIEVVEERLVLCGMVDDPHTVTLAGEVARSAAAPHDVENRLGIRPDIGDEGSVKETEFGSKARARSATGQNW